MRCKYLQAKLQAMGFAQSCYPDNHVNDVKLAFRPRDGFAQKSGINAEGVG
jgi:hypothetical protein